MKIVIMILVLMLIAVCAFAQAPDWQWATQASGNGYDYGFSITSDTDGNTYVTGTFGETATFGSYTIASSGDDDIFVAKIDSSGNWLWANNAGGSYQDRVRGITIDDNGNSYVTGSFQGTATFGTYTIASNGDDDIFVAKIDSNGNWLWATNAGGSYSGIGYGITIDDAGNNYVTGAFEGTATFGSYTFSNSGNVGIFVAKIDSNGNWLWATDAGGSYSGIGYGITIDDAGNNYITGTFAGTATFGSYTFSSSGMNDIFVGKIDSSGNWLWATNAGGSSQDLVFGITKDDTGCNFITGSFYETATFGSYIIASSGAEEIFVAKIDSSGNWLWANNAGGFYNDCGRGITIDEAGSNYITGTFAETATFGSYTIACSGVVDIFVAKIDSNGNWLWVTNAGGNSADYGYGITIDDAGNSYITGRFQGTATFGSYIISNSGDNDIFVAKLGRDFYAEFIADETSGYFPLPLSVNFTDLSIHQDPLITWEWDFQNDGTIDSNEQNPQWTYDEIGLYSVALTTSDGIYTDSEIKEDYIIVNPNIDFSYQTEGVIESGISLLSEDILYSAASGDCVYRFNNSGQIEYALNVNGDIKSATTITPDHNVYIASTDYNLYSFNSNGVSNAGWPISLGAEATASVASDTVGNIYIGTQNGIFQAITPSGENIWSYNVGAPVYSSVVISSDNTLYVINANGRLYAFDLNTINPGNVDYKWRIETNAAISSTPALDDNSNIYITNENGQLIKINDDGTNGNIVWTFESGSTIMKSSPIIDSDHNVYFGCDEGKVYSVNDLGQLNWTSDEMGAIKSTGALFESDEIQSRIYIGSDDGALYALSTDAGTTLWQFTTDSAIVCPILYSTGKVYFGTIDGEIFAINDPDISVGAINRNTSIWSTFQGNNLRTGYQTDNMVSGEHVIFNHNSNLFQNYPNPFNPETSISFSIPNDSEIELTIYNIKGQRIKTLTKDEFAKGTHSIIWSGDDEFNNPVSSGIYFYKLNVNGKTELVKKCLLLK